MATLIQILGICGAIDPVAAAAAVQAAFQAAAGNPPMAITAAIETALNGHILDQALRTQAAAQCYTQLTAPVPAPVPLPVPPAAPAPAAPAAAPAGVNLPAMPVTAAGIHVPQITLVPAGTQGTAIMASPPAAVQVVTGPRWWQILLIVLAGILILAILTIGIVHLCVGAKSADLQKVDAKVTSIKDDTAYNRKMLDDTLPFADGRRVHIPNLIEAQHDGTRDEVRDQGAQTRKAITDSEGRIKSHVSVESRRTRIAIGDAAKREQRIRVILLPDGSARAVRQ